MMVLLSLIFFCFISLPFNIQLFVVAVDNISPNQTLTDNGQTLVSFRNTFELGFFSPLNSNNRYIGIWFRNVPTRTAVWVANGNNPLPPNSSAVLSISPTGNILITGNDTRIVWSSSSSSITVRNPILQLLDNGNLVVINENNSGNYVWQSFDHPCDTLIPGMRFGWNLRTNQEWYLTSWRSLQDPSSGEYTYRMSPRGLPQIVLRRDSQITYRSGPWDGVRFGGAPVLQQNPVFRPIVVFNSDYVYYAFEDTNNSSVSRFVVNQTGQIQHLVWSQSRNIWVDIATLQSDTCDTYGACGPNGICTVNGNPICDCPNGFVPRLPQDWWEALDFSGGCVQRPLNCSEPQGFRRFARMKLPDISYFVENGAAMDQVACEDACMRNCSCVAYARTEINECVVWFGNLLDVRVYNEGGQDLYIRMAASELGSSNNTRRRTAIIASVPVILGVILLGLISWYVYRKRIAKRTEVLNSQRLESPSSDNNESIGEDDLELPLFDFPTISTATNSFSFTNKIGEGGFGPVYKGVLSDGQEIAVKRLSKDSGQGLGEFKNEIILITKLQHRNLVRVLGCCIRRSERMLIYEYMPNKSLEMFIFNETRRVSLDWGKRFDIIVGIARGLLYLHRDSRLRIIHRDLKASNILLDGEMNPKISDFGLARTFGGDQSEENTNRVVGTYGYMSPEYAIDGLFSVKSDVFSFGVLVLEILSGMKNRGFIHPDHDLNLLGHAWKLWNERKPMNLMDALIRSRVSESEVLRCIQVGLLCVQQRPEDRPTMSTVLLMLDSENPMLPQPKQPGFYTERFPGDAQSSSTGKKPFASNEVTITLLHGR